MRQCSPRRWQNDLKIAFNLIPKILATKVFKRDPSDAYFFVSLPPVWCLYIADAQ